MPVQNPAPTISDDGVPYSFALEYDGPPISHQLPRAAPIIVNNIPVASVVSTQSFSGKLTMMPVVQPIFASNISKNFSKELKLVPDNVVSPTSVIGFIDAVADYDYAGGDNKKEFNIVPDKSIGCAEERDLGDTTDDCNLVSSGEFSDVINSSIGLGSSSVSQDHSIDLSGLSAFITFEFGREASIHISLPSDQPYRTGYHFQPPRNWMNDPNGPMYYKGVYHFFYQYNPYGPLFGDIMVWAHSVSYDLVNWIHLDPAIYPTDPFDINSCFSGSATFLPGNKPAMLYTGLDTEKRQVQNLAVPKNLSDPFLREWVKHKANPIMTTPEGVKADDFRDPSTAWLGFDGKWRVVVGSKKNNLGVAYLYQSKDFVKWDKFDYPLMSMLDTSTWECPDFYPVSVNSVNGLDTSAVNNPGVKHVVKVGFNGIDWYTIGVYKPERDNYIPENDLKGNSLDLRYDYGKFYASKSFFDYAKNRRVLWGWVGESDAQEDDVARGWSGLQAVPRSVWLDSNGKQLIEWPVEEIEQLRENEVKFDNKELQGESRLEVEGITASQADVSISFKLSNLEEAEMMDPSWTDPQSLCTEMDASSKGKLGPFGLLALASKDLTEQTAIFFRVFQNHGKYVVLMCSDQSRSSVGNNIDKTTYGAFVNIDPKNEEISLRSLIDHSIIESFGGEGKSCITTRVYPRLATHNDAHLFAFNHGTENVVISKLNAWSMKRAQINAEDAMSSS